jgi:phospholipid-binding lipoprotein MlaA
VRTFRGALALSVSLAFLALPAFAGGDPEASPAAPAAPAALADPPGEGLSLEAADPLFDDAFLAPEVYDPFEGGNRLILRFNQGVDRVLWSPLTTAYRFAVPDPARTCLRRALHNLNTPVYMVNHLLQLRPVAAAETLGAFVMNTGWGLGGLFDAASAVGLESKPADFGQTLALAGLGSGPYLVIPIFGPSTLRDGFGWVVDRAFHPLTYILGVPVQLVWRGGAGVAERDAVADALDALEESSLDFYAVLRSAYVQSREKVISDARGHDDDEPPAVASFPSP